MAHLVCLSREDDFEGWREAARALAGAGIDPGDVVWQVGDGAQDLFAAAPAPLPATLRELRVPRDFVALARAAILHHEPQRFALLYGALLRVCATPGLIRDRADRPLRRLALMGQAVGRDMHKMRAFVRFRALEDDQGERYIAWFEPEHHILRANAAFFVNRFANRRWSILTPRGSLHWDGDALAEGPPARRGDAPSGDPTEAIWHAYYAAIFNPARLMRHAMLKEMPRKYWHNMAETALIPGLIAGARAREIAMIERSRATAPDRPEKDQSNSLSGTEASAKTDGSGETPASTSLRPCT